MTQSFAFPPPPPPPPKRQNDTNSTENRWNSPTNSHRGRTGHRGAGSASGRGGYRNPRGSYNNSKNRSTLQSVNDRVNPSVVDASSIPPSLQVNHPNIPGTSSKRNHATAFQPPVNSQTVNRKRPLAPPAIPSFGLDLEGLLPKRPSTTSTIKDQPKKVNLLGLTPTTNKDDSSDEDDEDEESKLANATSENIGGVEIVYRGQISTLRTPEEIAAWIAERRKNYPTQEKADKAKKEAAAKKAKWDAERKARLEAAKEAARARQEQRSQKLREEEMTQIREKMLEQHVRKARNENGTQQDEVSHAERLRYKAQRAARKLEKAEEALRRAEKVSKEMSGPVQIEDTDLNKLVAEVEDVFNHQGHNQGIASSATVEDQLLEAEDNFEDTSSSGTSSESETDSQPDDLDSDSDATPEVESSKLNGPEKVPPPSRVTSASSSTATTSKPLCRNFSKYGRCRHGKHCRFLHEQPDKKKDKKVWSSSNTVAGGSKRKRLFQVMVEKEQEEERKMMLQAIIALGERGVFEDEKDVSKEAS